jgi:hypothetical protein
MCVQTDTQAPHVQVPALSPTDSHSFEPHKRGGKNNCGVVPARENRSKEAGSMILEVGLGLSDQEFQAP